MSLRMAGSEFRSVDCGEKREDEMIASIQITMVVKEASSKNLTQSIDVSAQDQRHLCTNE